MIPLLLRVTRALARRAVPLALLVEMETDLATAWHGCRETNHLVRLAARIDPLGAARAVGRCVRAVAPLLPRQRVVQAALAAGDAWLVRDLRGEPADDWEELRAAARCLLYATLRSSRRGLPRRVSSASACAVTEWLYALQCYGHHHAGFWGSLEDAAWSAERAASRVDQHRKRWTRRRLGHRLSLPELVRATVRCPAAADVLAAAQGPR